MREAAEAHGGYSHIGVLWKEVGHRLIFHLVVRIWDKANTLAKSVNPLLSLEIRKSVEANGRSRGMADLELKAFVSLEEASVFETHVIMIWDMNSSRIERDYRDRFFILRAVEEENERASEDGESSYPRS